MTKMKLRNPKSHQAMAFLEAATAVGSLLICGVSYMAGHDYHEFGKETSESHEEVIDLLEGREPESLLASFQEAGQGDESGVSTLKFCIDRQAAAEPVYTSVSHCMNEVLDQLESFRTRGLSMMWLGALGTIPAVAVPAYHRHRRRKTGEIDVNPMFMK